MSSSDIRDMLDLPKQAAPRPPPPKKIRTEPKKLDGMQRELYSLLGENTPPMAVMENKYKNRPDWRNAKKITPWKWKSFVHTGREDKLELQHWVKGGGDEDGDVDMVQHQEYAFAKYDTKMDLPEIKEDDYDKAYKDDDWSFEETKYLFEMCKEYDLRWLVIHDRYAYSSSRTIEDLKARFYQVFRALFDLRKEKGETLTQADQDLLKQMKYSKENEVKRKEHLESLLKRSPAEIAEEEALVIESRKLEAAAERMIAERQELMKLLDSPQAPQSSISQYTSSQGLQQLTNTLLSDKTKRRKETTPPPITPGTVLPSNKQSGGAGSSSAASSSNTNTTTNNQPAVKQEKNKSASSQGQAAVQALMQRKISSREESSLGISYHEKLQAGVHLRSTKITTYKPAVQAKVVSALTELGLPSKPVMPTAKVCAKFESLQHSINVLLEAKKNADKLDAEIKVLKTKNGGD